ncbi:STAS domain-containing protein [Nocardia sp. CDC153]|uniref:STAS domain-containing protein n=1 Tax=Nocardia sp. CDC153 TaxID=3112167 RepID=UPI002DB82815|nr:STAS domain-containing protein [Nocardia sp. CDC153]MEC3953665.1 STAS domain-containing protein [Nocardia sp. CDC153]
MADHEQDSSTVELRVRYRMIDDVAVVAVQGEVDTLTAPQLAAAVRSALDTTRSPYCILDLTEVWFLDGAGLQTLAEASKAAENRKQPLRIVVDANRPVIRPLEMSGLEAYLALYHTVEEALAA